MNRVKNTIAVCTLSAVLLFNSFAPVFSVDKVNDYKDHWAEKTIDAALEDGMIKGYDDGYFRPENTITRAEFFSIVNNAFGFDGVSEITPNDMATTAWYAKEVKAGLAAGYIHLDDDGGIDPLRAITREEAATIIAAVKGFYAGSVENNFIDRAEITDDFLYGINATSEKGIMNGTPEGNFLPQRNMTRAEAVVTLKRALDFQGLMDVVYNEAKVYGTDGYKRTIPANIVVKSAGTTLKNMTIEGDLIIDEQVGDGLVNLDNVVVKGATIIKGSGENSIVFEDASLKTVFVDQPGKTVKLIAEKNTTIEHVVAQTPLIIKEEDLVGNGFEKIIVNHRGVAKNKIDLKLENTELVELDIKGESTKVELDAQSVITELVVEKKAAAAEIKGRGKVAHASIHADGTSFEKEPVDVKVDSNIEAPLIKKEVVTSTSSSSSSGSSSSSSKKKKRRSSGGSSTTPVTPTEPEKPEGPVEFVGIELVSLTEAEDDAFPNQLSPGDVVEFKLMMSDGSRAPEDILVTALAENSFYPESVEMPIELKSATSLIIPDRLIVEDIDEQEESSSYRSYSDYSVNLLDLIIRAQVDNIEYNVNFGTMVQDVEVFAADNDDVGPFDQYRYDGVFADRYYIGDDLDLSQTVIKVSAYDYESNAGHVKVYRRAMNIGGDFIRVEGFDSSEVKNHTVYFHYDGPHNGFSNYMTSDVAHIIEKPAYTEIRIASEVDKKVYYQQDELDLSGLEVLGLNGEGDEEVVPVTVEDIRGFDPTEIGQQTLTIVKGDASVSFDIEVKDLFIEEIEFTPVDSDYFYFGGQMKVSILLSDGTDTDEDTNFIADRRIYTRAYYEDLETGEHSMYFMPLTNYRWPVIPKLGDFDAHGKVLIVEVSTSDMEVLEEYVLGPFEDRRDDEVLELAKIRLDEMLSLPAETVVDISLPTELMSFSYADRVEVEWSTSNQDIISVDGSITRPANGQGDTAVTMTATLTVGALEDTLTYQVTVLEEETPVNSITAMTVSVENNLLTETPTTAADAEVATLSTVGGQGQITYQLVSGAGDWGNRHFSIVADKLHVGSSDLGVNDYNIRVQASDEEGNTFTDQLRVRVGATYEVDKAVGLKVVKDFDDLLPSNRYLESFTIDSDELSSALHYVGTTNVDGDLSVPSQIQHLIVPSDRNKTITVPITGTYDTGQIIDTTIIINVPDNAAPEIVSNVNFFEDVKVGDTFTFDLSTMFTEPDGDEMTYGMYQPENFEIGTINFDGSILEFEPDPDAVGESGSLYLYADDGQVKSMSVFCMLDVIAADPTPVTTSAATEVKVIE